MKLWTTKLAFGALAFGLISLTACEKDEVRTVIQPGAAPTVTSSAKANIELSQPNSANNAITYTWTPVTFGYSTPVTYSVQFDKKGGDFSSPVAFDAGTATTKTLTVADLNSVYQGKGLVSAATTPVATAVDMRVVASVSAAAPTVVSATSSLSATPYAFCEQPAATRAWAIIGPAGVSWDTEVKLQYDCASKTYTYTGPLKADKFKFRYGGQWKDGLDLGGAWSATGGALSQGGSDIAVPAAGTYTIVLTPGTIDASNKITGASFTVK